MSFSVLMIRFWTRSKTTVLLTTTLMCPSTSPKSSSSPRQTPQQPSPLPCWTEWKCCMCQVRVHYWKVIVVSVKWEVSLFRKTDWSVLYWWLIFQIKAHFTAAASPADGFVNVWMDYCFVLCVPIMWVCVAILGYTQEEKVEIAHRHLIPHQLEQHGLTPQQLQIPQDTTQEIISK